MGATILDEPRCTVDGFAAATVACNSGRQMVDGIENSGKHIFVDDSATLWTWPKILPLEGVKSQKRPVLWFRRNSQEFAACLNERAVIRGLSKNELHELLSSIENSKSEQVSASFDDCKSSHQRWTLEKHEGLSIITISVDDDDDCKWFEAASTSMPHVIVAEFAKLKPQSKAFELLSSFPGALILLAGSNYCTEDETLLQVLGIRTRWSVEIFAQEKSQKELRPVPQELEECSEKAEVGPTFIHDVRICSPSSPTLTSHPWMSELLEEQLAPLYMEEFGADLRNLRQTQDGYGVKLSLMLQKDDNSDVPELLGFLAYKAWGAPMPGISVCALGVPSRFRGRGFGRDLMKIAEEKAAALRKEDNPGAVRLRSLPTAVRFYSRLGYKVISEDSDETYIEPPEDLDEDSLCVPMERICQESCYEARLLPQSPLQSWSPRRARHLEDGPTWLPVEAFMLPVAAA